MFMFYYLTAGVLIISTCTNALTRALNNSVIDETVDSYYPSSAWSDSFDWQLLKAFTNNSKNVLLSPASLKITLALLYEGSSGSTEREFQNVLQFPKKEELRKNYQEILSALQASERKEYILNLGTRIFLDSNINPQLTYKAKVKDFYQTDIEPTNFEEPVSASQGINSWIEKITNGKVMELTRPSDLTDAIMLIANAIYFKGTWRHQFPKNQTHYGKFHVNEDEMVSVPYMSTTDTFYFHESVPLDAKILRLPYKGNRYSLFIVLPNSISGLSSLIKKISLQSLHRELYSMSQIPVEVRIPKFKFNFQARFSEVLKKFGLQQMFQNTASFPGIARGNATLLRRLVVTDIIQKSGLELDEEGSVVYAATDITIGNKFGDAEYTFNATHPFLFFIEEQINGTILFVGKVENPLDMHSLPIPNRLGENEAPVPVVPPPVANTQSQQPLPVLPFQENAAPSLNPSLQPPTENTELEAITNRFNYFDLELLEEFSESNENVFISPASIKTTLAMILEGARGLCAQEIGNALRITNVNEKDIRIILSKLLFDLNDKSTGTNLESSNNIFVSNKLKVLPEYEQTLKQYYKGNIKPVDFKNVNMAIFLINSWVYNTTHGAIKEIVSPQNIYAETSIVLANALYFKGKWKTPFDAKSTRPMCFKSPGRGCVTATMMQVADSFNYSFINDLNAHAVELPYEDKYSMLILLPSNENGIRVLTRDMQHVRFADILNTLKHTEIILELPKFQMDYSVDLIEYLKPLKIREIFGNKANLTGIVANDNIKINNLVHKTRVEVDEQGTVAAAATGAVVIPLMGSSSLRLVADHPFLFFIYNKESRNIIFEGILIEPTNNNKNVEYRTVVSRGSFPQTWQRQRG